MATLRAMELSAHAQIAPWLQRLLILCKFVVVVYGILNHQQPRNGFTLQLHAKLCICGEGEWLGNPDRSAHLLASPECGRDPTWAKKAPDLGTSFFFNYRSFDVIMAPKRGTSKHGGRETKSSSMALRSGLFKRRHVEQEVSCRAVPRSTPIKKRGKWSKRCIFVDDEAQIEEGSSVILDEDDRDKDVVEEQSCEDDTQKKTKHSRQMGKRVPLGIMNDVLSQFYVKCRSSPLLVPLCRLVPHEAVRFALDEASWLIPSFDTAAYLESMGSFLVSIKGPSGELMPITTQNLEEWDPIWIQKSAEFDKSLWREWQDLKGQKFLVWDGKYRLKTWLKHIKDG
ncbi:hypothetical protein L7F22_066721 [Adiantum nelumboides]|nr:hypothetical protein [Adiantum nelumboides]